MLRFTESEKWMDPWFQRLDPESKLFYLFLLDVVDHAGVWEENWAMAEFLIGQELNHAHLLGQLESRVVAHGGTKFFLPKFVHFQIRGKELKPDYNPHKAILRSLKKHGLIYSETEGLTKPCPSLDQGFQDKIKTRQGQGQGQGEENDILSFIEQVENYFTEEAVVELFHEFCPSLPSVRSLTPKRKKVIKSLIGSELEKEEDWIEFFKRIERSSFLSGKKTEWRANLDWILKPANFHKIMEGNYDERSNQPQDHAKGF